MNIKYKISNWIERTAFVVLSVAAHIRGVDTAQVRKASEGLISDIAIGKIWVEHEIDVARIRLARRYDLSTLFNEITNRTIDLKKIEDDSGMGLTSKQLVALKFQQEYLARIAGEAK